MDKHQVHRGLTDSYQQKFRSLFSKCQRDFIREYKEYDEASAKEVYLQVLTQLAKAISEGNVSSLNKLSNLIEYIANVHDQGTLRHYYNIDSNPLRSTNLVILACKHNKVEILQSILINNKIIDNLTINIGNDAIIPTDRDATSHDAFYYAVSSGNLKLINTLVDKWPDGYFTYHSDVLDTVLSRSYGELKVKNVPLSDDMDIFILSKLINLRFFSNRLEQVKSPYYHIKNVIKRVNLVLENIRFLTKTYSNQKDVDEEFLFVAKFIAQNIHVLKRQLKSTYDGLPWEEIEFCLISYISSQVKRQEINLFYLSTLNKGRILYHLENFANELEDKLDNIKNTAIGKLSKLPKLKREKVVAKIISNCPQFKDLYKDYQQIRDIHSLEKIGLYIKLALAADPKQRQGHLIITRVLQVIGEHLKNTLESPKLSNTTSELLLLSLPRNTRKTIIYLRNSLSHADSLYRRTEIEASQDVNFFIGVQNDTNKIGKVINNILLNNKIKMIRMHLKKIASSDSLGEIREVAEVINTVELKAMISANSKLIEHKKLEKLIQELSDIITDKSDDEKKLFSEIATIFHCAVQESENTKIEADYITGLALLISLCSNLSCIIDHNAIRVMKFRVNMTLKSMNSEIEQHVIKKIAALSWQIACSAKQKMEGDNLDQVNRLVCEIFFIVEFQTGDMKFIEELRGKLNERDLLIPIYGEGNTYNLTSEKYDKQLAQNLSELTDILKNKLLIGQTVGTLSSYKNDKKLQAVVEMLVLDIMSILESSHNFLENNLLFLDDNAPLLNGKSLRNHLAHDNALVDILLSDPTLTIILNAKILTERDITKNMKKIGKFVIDDPIMLKEKYNDSLISINNQKKMFIAIEEGNLENLKDCLDQGADINGRSVNLWTTLHCAAKGSSLEILRFILDHNLSLNVKDNNGQSPMHIAAAYGGENIAKFLIKDKNVSLDDADNFGKTALHVAAQHGYKDTVEVLLENKANTTCRDLSGFSPLHYAIRNNHVEVVKILLAKDKTVIINDTAGGYTPLHVAAEYGHLEILNFLLQNKANPNARNDDDWTALHAAALNGHLEIEAALIRNGADVNVNVIDGCTPLHYATENGHEEIVQMLLTHGAKVNAADKNYNCTPLHNATLNGYAGIVEVLLKNKANATIKTVDGMTPLHLAARNNHLKIVSALLKYGVNIHAEDKNKFTPLHYSVEDGHKKLAEFLIKNGAEVNAKDVNDLTPLHIATTKGHEDIADLLIRNGANVDAKNIGGITPLHTAAMNGSAKVIKLLINSNKNKVNSGTNEGMTPLHLSALNGNLEAISFLIQNNAQVNARANYGITPLHSAVSGGHKDAVKLLIKNKAQLDAGGDAYPTPLHIAVQAGSKEIVQILVSNGARVDAVNNTSTPLLSAIKCNREEIVELLITNGAAVNIGFNELKPIQAAVLGGNRNIVEILLKNKADINIKDVEHITPLHIAAKGGHKEIVDALIKSGASVDALGSNNVTPLNIAAQEGYCEIVESLIKNGGNVNIEAVEGTPLHIASGRGHGGVVKVLLENGAEVNMKDQKNRTSLELAVAHGHLEIVEMILDYEKVDLNLKGNDNWTVLHIASQISNYKMVKYLVAEGSNINATNASGSKPIHIAAREGHKDTVEFFLRKGLSINEAGTNNQTLLHYAAMNGHLEVAKYLISKGANVNAQDTKGISPLHIAAVFGYKDVIELLLNQGAFYNGVNKLNEEPFEMCRDQSVINLFALTKQLFMAVKDNNCSEVRRCIEAGALVNARRADGGTALLYAVWKGFDTIVNDLLNNKADPNTVFNKGTTYLHYAAKFSYLKVVLALLTHGAVYNTVSDSGKTPLDFAVEKSITSLLQLVSESFNNIKNGNTKVITILNEIKDVDTLKAIMCARNRDKESLVVAAVRSNFPKLEQLKQISQGDLSHQIKIALVLLSQNNYKEALSIFKSAYEKRKGILGPDNPGTLDIQTHIGRLLYAQGSYEEALKTLEEIYQKQREMLGLNNKETLSTRSTIALVLHRLMKNEDALHIYLEVCQKQEEILGPNHSDTLDSQLHMALVLDGLAKYEEALSINRRLFEKLRVMLGASDPKTLRALNNIAMVLSNQGNYEEALKIYKEVLTKKKMVFGINHCDTLRTLRNIASVHFNLNKHQEALQSYQELLNMQKNVLGPYHPETLLTQCHIADTLFAQCKWIGAFKAYRECFNKREAVLGSNHPVVLMTSRKLEKLIGILRLQGRNESEIIQNLQTEMNIAASNGDLETVQRLLQDGANLNETDIDGRTPLYYAVSNRRIDVINILLKAGANVTHVTHKGNTPLHTATSTGCKEIVEILLLHVNSDKLNDLVNSKTAASGSTSLHVAAKNGDLEIVISLLKSGAIFEIKNKECKTPLHFCQNQSVVDLLKLTEVLFRSVKIGNIKMISELKALKPDELSAVTNARNNQGKTLLQVAMINKHRDIVSQLLEILKSSIKH